MQNEAVASALNGSKHNHRVRGLTLVPPTLDPPRLHPMQLGNRHLGRGLRARLARPSRPSVPGRVHYGPVIKDLPHNRPAQLVLNQQAVIRPGEVPFAHIHF